MNRHSDCPWLTRSLKVIATGRTPSERRLPASSTSAWALVCTLLFVSCLTMAQPNHGDSDFDIRTVSNDANLISGGDALVEIVPASAGTMVHVALNGHDIEGIFALTSDGRLLGLVRGLAIGQNVLTAKMDRGPQRRLIITNYPVTGPIFSGPQQQPFICETATFVLPVTGGTLGPPLDANCSTVTRIDYVYMSTGGTFKPLADPMVRPADLAQTTINEGRTVNYVVRVETGTINRAIYQLAILHDPKVDPALSVWSRSAGWNGRLVYSFGGGCTPGYHQGPTTGGVLNNLWLSKGFAAAASSLNVFGNNCNDVISAETATMVKEHFIERYGLPSYTIGWGTSGGSMQQHLLTENYPGLLDGITPGRSFPDALTFFTPISDCPLLARAFDTSTLMWTTDQKAAVAGWGTWDFCTTHVSSDWAALVRAGLSPGVQFSGCNAAIPPALIYDPATNPTGARCTWFDNSVNIFGVDPKTGFALRAIDSIGVQYGLKAFNAGQISAEQFLDLNERIGGYDADGNMVAIRTLGDRDGLRIAYETGRLNSGDGGLASVPIIDYRAYRDLVADPHDSVRSRIMRARLIATNGNAANQIILVGPYDGTPSGAAIFASLQADVLRLMDQWLANIAHDNAPAENQATKVVRDKPAELLDACYDTAGDKITNLGTCQSLYPVHANPRLVAGQPLAQDILKCQLKAVDSAHYATSLTAAQLARLKTIFPDGVCDYSRPGVEQHDLRDTWLAYPIPGESEKLPIATRSDNEIKEWQ
jgi:hypothetical protein